MDASHNPDKDPKQKQRIVPIQDKDSKQSLSLSGLVNATAIDQSRKNKLLSYIRAKLEQFLDSPAQFVFSPDLVAETNRFGFIVRSIAKDLYRSPDIAQSQEVKDLLNDVMKKFAFNFRADFLAIMYKLLPQSRELFNSDKDLQKATQYAMSSVALFGSLNELVMYSFSLPKSVFNGKQILDAFAVKVKTHLQHDFNSQFLRREINALKRILKNNIIDEKNLAKTIAELRPVVEEGVLKHIEKLPVYVIDEFGLNDLVETSKFQRAFAEVIRNLIEKQDCFKLQCVLEVFPLSQTIQESLKKEVDLFARQIKARIIAGQFDDFSIHDFNYLIVEPLNYIVEAFNLPKKYKENPIVG